MGGMERMSDPSTSAVDDSRAIASAFLVAAAQWLAEYTSETTRTTYSRALGLPYLVHAWDLHALADVMRQQFGVTVDAYAPSPRAVAPGWCFGPWVAARGVRFADCETAPRAVREWATGLVQWEREGVDGRRLGRNARTKRITAVCSFYDSLARPGTGHDGMTCDPCNAINRRVLRAGVRRAERPRPLIDMTAIGRLIAVAERYRTTETERRRLVAQIVTLASTGIRLGALQRLTVDDYQRREHGAILRVHDKGGEESLKVLGEDQARAVDRYLSWRPEWDIAPLPTGEPAPLFRRVARSELERGLRREMSASTFRAQLAECARAAGLPRITPHDLRAAGITHALDGGHSTRVVQAWSGHRSVDNVERYDRRRRSLGSPVGVDISRSMSEAVREAVADLEAGVWTPAIYAR